jgi:apolipoprotein D and lipocalin family protein
MLPCANPLQVSYMRIFQILLITLFASGCLGMPEGVHPVGNFEINRYLGKWYEIARLDHSFERGLEQVSAEYSLRDDGGLKVINRGFSKADNSWKEAEGKAYFAGSQTEGYLKVSFFGPFYGSYVVFDLDKDNYQYAFVAGYNESYLWLLSRTPTVSNELVDRFVDRAGELGFDTEKLVFVEHN